MIRSITCRHTEGAFHSCQHVDWRNSFIQRAERIARASCVSRGVSPDGGNFARAFFEAMEELTAPSSVRLSHFGKELAS